MALTFINKLDFDFIGKLDKDLGHNYGPINMEQQQHHFFMFGF